MVAQGANRRQQLTAAVGTILVLATTLKGVADPSPLPQDAHWIWSPAHRHQHVPEGPCYFRKTFSVEDLEQGEIFIACDDGYDLHVNGRHVGSGHGWTTLKRYDITPHLVPGQNVVAVKATNDGLGSAGLVAQIVVKPTGSNSVVFPTGADWKTSLQGSPDWNMPGCSDSQWLSAQRFGRLGATLPWGNEVRMAGEQGRFRTPAEFQVEWVLSAEATGSLTAMTFNGQGQIVAAREQGPILLISDQNQDGVHETISQYCDQVTNCHGLLALDGSLLAIGDGPEGAALYRLTDRAGNAKIDTVVALVRFQRPLEEYGPHAVVLGPEGLIYLAVGHATQLTGSYAPQSPHRHYYEGDLVQPRYEDPSGDAAGSRVPGGAILRTDANGSFVELVAGGLRNPYDLAFNRGGDLFTCDSDAEWDIGAPWYRPTRLTHIPPGAELGWRSGWAQWPEYFIDSLPATLHMGRGAPTGMEFYDHVVYPVRYHGALFVCDWARGCIHVVRLQPDGSTYRGQAEPFVEGRPLGATDLAVGPDGWLYFCTGGRGTTGGIYRVSWSGRTPPEMLRPGAGIQRALRQPQLQSAWARQRVADLQRELGAEWDSALVATAMRPANGAAQRTRALDLMQLFGPPPTPDLLRQLSRDPDRKVRAKATYLMGVQGDEATAPRLAELLHDPDLAVRRLACEAVVRGRYKASPARLVGLLASPDRFVAYAARRALEQLPSDTWRARVLKSRFPRIFLHGATALLVAHPDTAIARTVLDRCLKMIRGDEHQPGAPKGFISDQDFTDLLRVVQLALMRGQLTGADVPELRQQLRQEFPARDAAINRELARLLVFLGDPSATAQLLEPLHSTMPMVEKLHLAMVASQIEQGWSGPAKLELLTFFDQAQQANNRPGLRRYLEVAANRMATRLTALERQQLLEDGAKWPHAAFAVLAQMPRVPNPAAVQQIIALDRQLDGVTGDATRRLRLAIVAVLGRSRGAEAMAYLRAIFITDPARREAVAMGLAQQPGGENWPLLVQSLSILDGVAALEVLEQLANVERRPDGPEPLRQVILCALRTEARGAPLATKLLEHWTGAAQSNPDDGWEIALGKWQTWFAQTYPDQPAPHLAEDSQRSKWAYRELLSLLEGPEGSTGDPERGALVFQHGHCTDCHQFGGQGQRLGPDLTTVSQRLHKKQILESILFPSQVVADRYASKIVRTADGHTWSGIPAPARDDALVLEQPRGHQVTIPPQQIDALAPRRGSDMPDGLINALSLQQVADLFAFLGRPPRTDITSRRQLQSSQ